MGKLGIPLEEAARIRGVLSSWHPNWVACALGVVGGWMAAWAGWRVSLALAEAGVSHLRWTWGTRAIGHLYWTADERNAPALSLLDWTVMLAIMSGVFLWPVFWAMRWSSTARYRLVLGVIDAVVVGAKVRAAPRGRRRSRALRQLDQSCRHIEKRLFRVHSIAGSVPRRSSRLRPIKRHAALVAGAQRVALRQVDVDPLPALTELARLQLVIAENHLYGRQAALLPAELLQDVRPVSRLRNTWRESAHVATAILAAMAAAAGAARALPSMGVSEDVRPWLTLGAAVLAATLVAGWGRVTRILELFPA
ncbi:hypothetical protein ACFVOR_17140 [Streptomyces sp. NPDC057837]|uniref:hypothetical protein n=1 Tax=Streptomyces sp. NPDC057837 TaxID=3346260 RepID=UPI0036C5D3DA